jgi:hypothetical protein
MHLFCGALEVSSGHFLSEAQEQSPSLPFQLLEAACIAQLTGLVSLPSPIISSPPPTAVFLALVIKLGTPA